LVLRDRDPDGNGSLDERLYAMQDGNWSVTAIANASSASQERYASSAYGVPSFLSASFSPRGSSSYQWETLYAGYFYDSSSSLFHVRNRIYQVVLATWTVRDMLGLLASSSLYEYCLSQPIIFIDSLGLQPLFAPPNHPLKPFLPPDPPTHVTVVIYNGNEPSGGCDFKCGASKIVKNNDGLVDISDGKVTTDKLKGGMIPNSCIQDLWVLDHGLGSGGGQSCGTGNAFDKNEVIAMCSLLCDDATIHLGGCNSGEGRKTADLILDNCKKVTSVTGCTGPMMYPTKPCIRGGFKPYCDGANRIFTRDNRPTSKPGGTSSPPFLPTFPIPNAPPFPYYPPIGF
jgi:RHS repeat-associated protein